MKRQLISLLFVGALSTGCAQAPEVSADAEADDVKPSSGIPDGEASSGIPDGELIEGDSTPVETPSGDVAVAEQAIAIPQDSWHTFYEIDPGYPYRDSVRAPDSRGPQVCAGQKDGIKHPGKVVYSAGRDQCRIEYGGAWYYYVMPNSMAWYLRDDGGYRWCEMRSNDPPNTAVQASQTRDGKPVHVCAGYVNDNLDPNSWHPGKFFKGECLYEWNSRVRRDRVTSGGKVLILVRGTSCPGDLTQY